MFRVADVFSKKKRSKVMAAIRSKGNKATELKLASILRAYRITGWRRHLQILGSPDFAFRKSKLAIFVDGCFWHYCPLHGHMPRGKRAFWRKKLERNQARDRRITTELRRTGWNVIRLWEHQLGNGERVASRLLRKLASIKSKA
jgi:DNA mismatch endonuclease (patch repair protein)